MLGAARPERVGQVSAAVGLSLDVVGLDCALGDVLTLGEKGREAFLAGFEREGCCSRWSWAIGDLAGATADTADVLPLPEGRATPERKGPAVPVPSRIRRAS